jgi:hypothetical protein
MACKFIDSTGQGSISDAITCMDYARIHGAKVVNASWGSYTFDSVALRDTINSLRDAGMIFVAAAGNNGNDNEANSLFPASYEYDNIIAVAATDRNDQLTWFSNYGGTKVHLGAPGYNIFSCWNGSDSDYRYFDGTSMAAPHVSGTCALVWTRHPTETHLQTIRRVLLGTDPLPSLAGKCVTGGRLNLAKALRPGSIVQGGGGTTVWIDDALPAGAAPGADGGDGWNWIDSNPTPFSGGLAHQSDIGEGFHEHYFDWASDTLAVNTGDKLFVYVYLDPDNPPQEIMLCWNDGCWEHRAYWGANLIPYGADGTSGRLSIGPLPPVGQWARLEVPASLMGLEGGTLRGMSFVLFDGRASWDCMGKEPGSSGPPGQ